MFTKKKILVSQLINKTYGMQVVKVSPGWSTADGGIKVPSGENPELPKIPISNLQQVRK